MQSKSSELGHILMVFTGHQHKRPLHNKVIQVRRDSEGKEKTSEVSVWHIYLFLVKKRV